MDTDRLGGSRELCGLALWDKILPDQPINSLHYRGPREEYHERLYGTLARASGVEDPRSQFEIELSDVVPLEVMASNPLALRFLELLVALIHPRRILEIGSYIGVSTMVLARAMGPGGRVIAIEKFDHFAGICRRNFVRNRLADRIELHEGDAREVLARLELDAPLDLAFIDGDKERYADYFLRVEELLRPGGIVIIDDILFQGDVLNTEPQTAKGAGVCRFLDLASKMDGWMRAALPFSDGMMLMLKPARGDG